MDLQGSCFKEIIPAVCESSSVYIYMNINSYIYKQVYKHWQVPVVTLICMCRASALPLIYSWAKLTSWASLTAAGGESYLPYSTYLQALCFYVQSTLHSGFALPRGTHIIFPSVSVYMYKLKKVWHNVCPFHSWCWSHSCHAQFRKMT